MKDKKWLSGKMIKTINDKLSFIKIKNTCFLKEYINKKKKTSHGLGENISKTHVTKQFRSRKY